MTPNEFIAWLDGFLDGKESLTAEQIATLRSRLPHAAPDILPTPVPNIPQPIFSILQTRLQDPNIRLVNWEN